MRMIMKVGNTYRSTTTGIETTFCCILYMIFIHLYPCITFNYQHNLKVKYTPFTILHIHEEKRKFMSANATDDTTNVQFSISCTRTNSITSKIIAVHSFSMKNKNQLLMTTLPKLYAKINCIQRLGLLNSL